MHDAFKVYTVVEKITHKIESIYAQGTLGVSSLCPTCHQYFQVSDNRLLSIRQDVRTKNSKKREGERSLRC